MGPVLIFDKSFIESLTLNESIWLDSFFLTNIVPIFYVETLADLEKSEKKGKTARSPEELVGELSTKTPILESCPNIHHQRLVIENLLGREVELSTHHRPIISGGKYNTLPDGSVGINFRQFPESAAMDRWKKHQFLEIERELASSWRRSLTNMNLELLVNMTKNSLPNGIHFSSIQDVKKYSDEAVKASYNQFIYLAFALLNVSEKAQKPIMERWHQTRPLSFEQFAPYAAFVMKINLFFCICLLKSFLAESHKGKSTNIIDLSYLYYLPFCTVFTSNDSFHKKVTPLFLEEEQTFIPGNELKEDLLKINNYYSKLPDKIKDLGTMAFAAYPPTDETTLVGNLYDKYFKSWRESAKEHNQNLGKPIEQQEELLKHFKKMQSEQKPYIGPPIDSDEATNLTLSRMIPLKRGDWNILPKNFKKDN